MQLKYYISERKNLFDSYNKQQHTLFSIVWKLGYCQTLPSKKKKKKKYKWHKYKRGQRNQIPDVPLIKLANLLVGVVFSESLSCLFSVHSPGITNNFNGLLQLKL